MKKENSNKKLLIIGIVTVVAITLITVGLTYAFFVAGIEGNDDATETVIETGELRLVFTDTEVLTLEDALPGVSASKTFTIENVGTIAIEYDIVLTELINEFVGDELVYTISSDNNGGAVAETPVPTNDSVLLSASIEPDATQTYTITITFKETGSNQNSNMGALFSGKLQVNNTGEYGENTPVLLTDAILRDNPGVQSDENIDFGKTNDGCSHDSESGGFCDENGENSNGRGLYYVSDPLDTEGGERVYYYRGSVENNNIKFGVYNKDIIVYRGYLNSTSYHFFDYHTQAECTSASSYNYGCEEVYLASTNDEMCWRIIRTNEDGSVRVMYYGVADENGYCPSIGNQTPPITSQSFAVNNTYNASVGYMYGTPGSSSYEEEHANTNNSNIKTELDKWYEANMVGYSDKIENAVYCNDRSIGAGGEVGIWTYTELGYGENYTLYGASRRFMTQGVSGTQWGSANANPTLVCAQENDKFTLSVANGGTSGYGNNALTYPVGLITADEVVYAGGTYGATNENYYLYYGSAYWWTMTPQELTTNTVVFALYANGALTNFDSETKNSFSAFPVISLKSDVRVMGSGTTTDPYVIE